MLAIAFHVPLVPAVVQTQAIPLRIQPFGEPIAGTLI